MGKKSTDDLNSALMEKDNLDSYLKENAPFFSDVNITEFLSEIYARKSITKAELARRAGISEVYLHQVFSGRRKPSRDRLLCLCIGLDATLEETQRLLKQVAFAQIYPKIKRDAIISYGIIHHMELQQINDKLFLENEKTLL